MRYAVRGAERDDGQAWGVRRGVYVGETLPLPEGTYWFGTIVLPQAYNLSQTSVASGDTVLTKVMVTDASALESTGVFIPYPTTIASAQKTTQDPAFRTVRADSVKTPGVAWSHVGVVESSLAYSCQRED